MKWEQKLVVQTSKTVVSNMFISCRMQARRQLLQSDKVFGDQKKCRASLNCVKFFTDWVYDLCPELLRMASKLATNTGDIEACSEDDKQNESLDEFAQARLRSFAKSHKRIELNFTILNMGVVCVCTVGSLPHE